MTVLQVLVDPGIDPETFAGNVGLLAATYLAGWVVGYALTAIAERSPRRRISIKMLIPIVWFLIYGTTAFLVLGPLLRLSTAQLLAVSGLLGAALGLGLKTSSRG